MMAHAPDLLEGTQWVEFESLDAAPTIADSKLLQPLADLNAPALLDPTNRIHRHFATHLRKMMHVHNNLGHLVKAEREHNVPGLK